MGLRSHLGIPGHGSGRRHGRPYLLGDKVFKLVFMTDNAAFKDNKEEIKEIFGFVLDKLDSGFKSDIVKDSNGNTIGHFELSDD